MRPVMRSQESRTASKGSDGEFYERRERSASEVVSRLRHVTRPDVAQSTVWEVQGDLAKAEKHIFRFGCRVDVLLFSIMRVVALIDALWAPFLLSFASLDYVGELCYHPLIVLVDLCLNVAYGLGTLTQLRISAVDLGLAVEYVEPATIFFFRLSSVSFYSDFMSLAGSFWMVSDRLKFLAYLRLLRMWRLSNTADDLYEIHYARLSTEKPLAAFLRILASIAVVTHMFACVWFAATAAGTEDYAQQLLDNPRYQGGSLPCVYLYYIADGATMLVGWGGPLPSSKDNMYSAVELLTLSLLAPAAALWNAFVVTQLLKVVEQASAGTDKHLDRMAQASTWMEPLRIPDLLKHRFVHCTAFLSVHNQNKEGENQILDSMSKDMLNEVKVHLFDNLVMTAPFFQEPPAAFVMQVICAFEDVVYTPGDLIFKKGDLGEELFFVTFGSVNVLDSSMHVLAVKRVGEYFGEMALVYDQPRTATCCTEAYCILEKLTRSAFEECLDAAGPDIRERIIDQIVGQLRGRGPLQRGSRSLLNVCNGSSSGHSEKTPLLDGHAADVTPLNQEELAALRAPKAEKLPSTPLGSQRDRAVDASIASSLRTLTDELVATRQSIGLLESRFSRLEARLATYPFWQ